MDNLFLDSPPDRWRVQWSDYSDHKVGTKRPRTQSLYFKTRDEALAAKARLREQSAEIIAAVRPVYARR